MSDERSYAVWDVTVDRATDSPDGLPDRAMVPLVVALRAAGFTTYQSCMGHFGESDGVLWIKEGPHRDRWPDTTWFQRIQHVHYGPEGDYWEFHWDCRDAGRVIEELVKTYGIAFTPSGDEQ